MSNVSSVVVCNAANSTSTSTDMFNMYLHFPFVFFLRLALGL